MGEIRPKKCEGRELTKDQLAGLRRRQPARRAAVRRADHDGPAAGDEEVHHNQRRRAEPLPVR